MKNGKNLAIVLVAIIALLISSISLVASLGLLNQTESEESNPIPPEGFISLGGRPGFGSGTFSVNLGETLCIYNDTVPGEHIVTITVTNEGTLSGALLEVQQCWALYGPQTTHVLGPGDSITLTYPSGWITWLESWITVRAVGGNPVNGYYFVHFFLG